MERSVSRENVDCTLQSNLKIDLTWQTEFTQFIYTCFVDYEIPIERENETAINWKRSKSKCKMNGDKCETQTFTSCALTFKLSVVSGSLTRKISLTIRWNINDCFKAVHLSWGSSGYDESFWSSKRRKELGTWSHQKNVQTCPRPRSVGDQATWKFQSRGNKAKPQLGLFLLLTSKTTKERKSLFQCQRRWWRVSSCLMEEKNEVGRVCLM